MTVGPDKADLLGRDDMSNYAGCIFLQDCNRYRVRRVEARNYNGDGISFQICHDVLVEECHIHAYGTMRVAGVLAKSSNIGAIQIALRAGSRNLLDYVRRFGFGERTGIPVPGESRGLVHPLKDWTATSIGSVAMGHELSATSVQLASAVSVIAGGGLRRQPRLVLWRRKPGAGPVPEPFSPPVRVLRPETAIHMRKMMEGVVLAGTGTRARLKGYSSGGKTGSAQMVDPVTGRHSHTHYNSSFVGFAPVGQPEIVVAVTLNGATRYGGVVAAPVFREVAQAALRYLGVPPDVPANRPAPPVEEEQFDDLADASFATLPPPPQPGAASEPGPVLLAEAVSPFLVGPLAPNLYGKTLRSAIRETAGIGVAVEYHGSGVVRMQDPPPGAVLPVGGRMRLELER